jgi:hypothetical protein
MNLEKFREDVLKAIQAEVARIIAAKLEQLRKEDPDGYRELLASGKPERFSDFKDNIRKKEIGS